MPWRRGRRRWAQRLWHRPERIVYEVFERCRLEEAFTHRLMYQSLQTTKFRLGEYDDEKLQRVVSYAERTAIESVNRLMGGSVSDSGHAKKSQ